VQTFTIPNPNINILMCFRTFILLTALVLALQSSSVAHAQAPKPADITELDQALAEVPRDVLLGVRNSNRKEQSATAATDILRSKVEGRTATLKFQIEKIEKYQRRNEKEDRYRIKAENVRLRESATTFTIYLWVHFDPSQNAKFATMKTGSEISVTGKITLASITARNNPELHIDLSDAAIN
jgi:hypothetical protein